MRCQPGSSGNCGTGWVSRQAIAATISSRTNTAQTDMDGDQAGLLGLAADMGHELTHRILGGDGKEDQPVQNLGDGVIGLWASRSYLTSLRQAVESPGGMAGKERIGFFCYTFWYIGHRDTERARAEQAIRRKQCRLFRNSTIIL